MRRRSHVVRSMAAVVLVAAVWGCGGDDGGGGGSGVDTVYDFPTGENDVVVRVGYTGGFGPEGFDFIDLPAAMIVGDGRYFTPAAIVAIYPGPLVPSMNVRDITPQGIDAALAIADAGGLLAAAPTYAGRDDIADASTTVVRIDANGGPWVHEAYALGADGLPEDDPDRLALQQFAEAMVALDATIGPDQFGVPQAFVPEQYRIRAVPGDPSQAGLDGGPAETVAWPADAAGVDLADALDCARVDSGDVRELFDASTQLTFFTQAGQAYRLFVAPVLPGDGPC